MAFMETQVRIIGIWYSQIGLSGKIFSFLYSSMNLVFIYLLVREYFEAWLSSLLKKSKFFNARGTFKFFFFFFFPFLCLISELPGKLHFTFDRSSSSSSIMRVGLGFALNSLDSFEFPLKVKSFH